MWEEEDAARSELVSLIRVPQEHRTADQVRKNHRCLPDPLYST